MPNYRVACLNVFAPEVVPEVEAELPQGFEMVAARSYDDQERFKVISGADFLLFAGRARLTGELMDAAPKLRLIQKWGIGYDKIDLGAAMERGIPVAIMAGANSIPVAEHTLLLMLAVYKRLPQLDRNLREGRYLKTEMRRFCYQLNGKTVGIVGLGNIGKEVARRVRAFNCRVLYHDTSRSAPDVEHQLGAEFSNLDDLFAQADIVTLHTPLLSQTRNLVGARLLSLMKPTAILINCSRGGVVDEPALIEALKTGRILGAGLDVLSTKPPEGPSPLFALDNVVLTPHTAGAVIDNVANMARHAFANMVRVARGEPLPEADLVRL